MATIQWIAFSFSLAFLCHLPVLGNVTTFASLSTPPPHHEFRSLCRLGVELLWGSIWPHRSCRICDTQKSTKILKYYLLLLALSNPQRVSAVRFPFPKTISNERITQDNDFTLLQTNSRASCLKRTLNTFTKRHWRHGNSTSVWNSGGGRPAQ